VLEGLSKLFDGLCHASQGCRRSLDAAVLLTTQKGIWRHTQQLPFTSAQVRVLGETYTPEDEEDSTVAEVTNVWVYQARYRVPLAKAVAGASPSGYKHGQVHPTWPCA